MITITVGISLCAPAILQDVGGGVVNLIRNGTFDTDTEWQKGSGWSISGGTGSQSDGTANFSALTQQALGLVDGQDYNVSFDVVTYVSGQLQVFVGTNGSGGSSSLLGITSAGPHSYVATKNSGQGDAIHFRTAASGFEGSIDNVIMTPV